MGMWEHFDLCKLEAPWSDNYFTCLESKNPNTSPFIIIYVSFVISNRNKGTFSSHVFSPKQFQGIWICKLENWSLFFFLVFKNIILSENNKANSGWQKADPQ